MKLDKSVLVRASDVQMQAWRLVAEGKGLGMGEWIRGELDRAAGLEGDGGVEELPGRVSSVGKVGGKKVKGASKVDGLKPGRRAFAAYKAVEVPAERWRRDAVGQWSRGEEGVVEEPAAVPAVKPVGPSSEGLKTKGGNEMQEHSRDCMCHLCLEPAAEKSSVVQPQEECVVCDGKWGVKPVRDGAAVRMGGKVGWLCEWCLKGKEPGQDRTIDDVVEECLAGREYVLDPNKMFQWKEASKNSPEAGKAREVLQVPVEKPETVDASREPAADRRRVFEELKAKFGTEVDEPAF